MDDQYGGMADLRQYMNGGRAHFAAIPPPPGDLFSGGRNLTLESQHHHHNNPYLVQQPHGAILQHHEFPSDSTGRGGGGAAAASSGASLNGLEMDGGCGGVGFGDGGGGSGSGRWPRQETLTLLEIRSRLDSKFKEANQKGPLWDEVSRIMSEEHGYQRSGKKCREKFENLYKYYKKTKEGKAGRQDGKHYRFFRQLEALYGDHITPISTSDANLMGNNFHFHNPNNTNVAQPRNQESFFQAPKHCDSHSLSLSNSSEFDTSSSDGNETNKKKRTGRRNWKSKIRDFIDIQMRKLMEKQEEWLEKMMKTLERKEQERAMREEEWRKQERERVEREHKFWANERAWIEARDAALMEALNKMTGKEDAKGEETHRNENGSETISNENWRGESWPESEITKMIELRVGMESRFQQSGCLEEVVWEEIAAKMGCFGYDRSGLMCKEKWDRINNYIGKTSKKRKENYPRGSCYYQGNEGIYHQGGGGGGGYCEIINEQRPEIITRIAPSDHGSSTPNSNTGNAMAPDSCFRFLVGSDEHGENLWENYGHVRIGKGGN